MPLTVHDILMDADAFRRAYPGWPLTGRQLTDYSDMPGYAIPPEPDADGEREERQS
jgi:hypothetical protein